MAKRFIQSSTAWIVITVCGVGLATAAEQSHLVEPVFQPLPLGSIRPLGWLKDQLRIQADGLTGHLDEFWPDIQESGWIGGEAEGWERLPYWLDGLVPLAYLLNDQTLIKKAETTIDYILQNQHEDGWLGPEKSAKGRYQPRDPWPVFVALKALTQYESATGDPRVFQAVTRYLKVLDQQLKLRPLFEWNRMRWQDGALSVFWLYGRSREQWLLDLAGKFHNQGYNWIDHFRDLPHKSKVGKWEHESHVVNNAMGLKTAAVWYRLSKAAQLKREVPAAIRELDRYHGQASGIFSGDECFAGRMPSQGTETCAVVEYLFSLEVAISILGTPELGDRLEKIAFNALPAPFKPDMWARQYVQQANQPIAKVSEDRIYTTNGAKANLFGLETNYGCCTANMHQGWPKFASHLWMKTSDGGLAAVAYAPSTVTTRIGDVTVRITLETDYPFSEELQFLVETDRRLEFPLKLRIPSWANNVRLRVNNEAPLVASPGVFHELMRTWETGDRVHLSLPMSVGLDHRFNNAVTLTRGPLVYSLNVGEDWRKIAGDEPHADWEVHPTSKWNYALEIDAGNPAKSVRFESRALGGNPYSSMGAPVRLIVSGRLLPGWTLERNAAAAPPESPVQTNQPSEELELVPYGATKLRITEFPWTEDGP